MSEKVQILDKLADVAVRLVYPPQPSETPEEIKRLKGGVEALKELAAITAQLTDIGAQTQALVNALQSVEKEVKKAQVLGLLGIISGILAIVYVALFAH